MIQQSYIRENSASFPRIMGDSSIYGKVWVSDITYIPSEQGWLYLTTVMDLADRQILGWSLSKNIMSAGQTSEDAFKQAYMSRPIGLDLLFHSDRSIQYVSWKTNYPSMNRKGNVGTMHRPRVFFETLKAELEIPGKYRDSQQARQAFFEFIEIWYAIAFGTRLSDPG